MSTEELVATQKILTLEDLSQKSAELKRQGKRVVMCHGVFDLVHTGHIRHLNRARQNGDALVVTVTADKFVNKGPGRPVFHEDLRAETLAALSCVNFVAINRGENAVEAIGAIKPNFYIKGRDYKDAQKDVTGNIVAEQDAVKSHGGQILFTDEITFSSSGLLNEHFGVFPHETRQYLQSFRKKYSSDYVIDKVKSLAKLNVLVFGDAIVDEYHYTEPLGQTGKGNILSVKYDSTEQFAGGAIAAANHLASFTKHVTLVTGLGKTESHEEFIRSKLQKDLKPVFFHVDGAPTIVKRRFVDPDMAKLFEIYLFKDEPMPETLDKKICAWLEAQLEGFDVVIVPDFGNGFISSRMVEILSEKSRFLAVNTQVNSGNRGYHAIHRYPKADFVSLNEPELRLSSHNRHDPLKEVASDVAKRVRASNIAVTRGTKGVLMLNNRKGEAYELPALSTKVIDRIGAGDSFLSLAGLCLGGKLKPEVAAFVGSAAAALDVQIVCNRDPIQQASLFKYITTLLK